MILTLYCFLVTIALALVVIGLLRPTESAQALIGFTFLFLLSFVIISGSLQYETGANITTSYGYTGSSITSTTQHVAYGYNSFDDATSRSIGIYMALGSAVGFVGVLYAIGSHRWGWGR